MTDRLTPGLQLLDIAKIRVGRRLRKVSDTSELEGSIKAIGLQQPIVVRDDGTLIAGNNRLTAHKHLGRTMIHANVRAFDDLDAELAEIDENLMRYHLTTLEEGEHLARRREILRQKGLLQGAGRPENSDSMAGLPPKATTADLAAGAGISERTLQRRVKAVESIAPRVREAIRDTKIANSPKDLAALALLPEAEQEQVADMLQAGSVSSVSEAQRVLHPLPDLVQEARNVIHTGAELASGWDDDVAHRLEEIEVRAEVSFRVPSTEIRKRGDDYKRRESAEFVQEIIVTFDKTHREDMAAPDGSNLGGLWNLAKAVGKAIYHDPLIRKEWLNRP